jgi:hypothetical protein
MKTTLSLADFHDAFINAGRKEDFSWEGRAMLFDYLEEYEQSTAEELEIDVLALCCDYGELSTAEVIDDYSLDVEGVEPEDLEDHVGYYLCKNTAYIGVTEIGTHLFMRF